MTKRKTRRDETPIAGDDAWWRRAVIYELYPRSFQDSDGDGIGDLQGIIDRLDYLEWLGIDAVWITPIYPSPMADFGYDVADYTGIHPLFGDFSVFDRLVAKLHARNIRLILDFVPNHTSDRHPWFLDAKGSRDARRRDWFIWRDPAPDGGPPNNWVSIAGGDAWTFDETTGQYFCHFFLKEQPDLNWRTPDVREAMYDAMRFWFERGVDGFRLDVCWLLIKDERFRSDPLNPDFREGQPDFRKVLPLFSADRPEILEIMAEMRGVAEEFGEDRALIGEIYLPPEKLVAYYGEDGRGLHLPFNFNLMWQAWNPAAILAYIRKYESALPPQGWPSWVLGNHDQKRIASRVGAAQARVAMLILLTLRGTPTLYYGDELGLENVAIAPGQGQDPFGHAHPDQGRDPVRTPMPWRPEAGAGFTEGGPWLPIGEDNARRNVEAQRDDPTSILHLTRRLLALRRAEPALSIGAWRAVMIEGEALAYAREADGRRLIIIANLDTSTKTVRVDEADGGRVILSTVDGDRQRTLGPSFTLRGDEAVIVRT
ncbi:MAG: alpha-amylase family glycosyl hydrolase [Geminicoccaceae bacterium]